MNTKFNSIELLYFDGCPSWKHTYTLLQEILHELGIEKEILLLNIETNDEASKNKFQGSPMIKINHKDIFPTDHTDYALGCRIYKTPEGFRGAPSKAMIVEKLNQLIN